MHVFKTSKWFFFRNGKNSNEMYYTNMYNNEQTISKINNALLGISQVLKMASGYNFQTLFNFQIASQQLFFTFNFLAMCNSQIAI